MVDPGGTDDRGGSGRNAGRFSVLGSWNQEHPRLTVAAFGLVILMAIAALILPRQSGQHPQAVFLVFDSARDQGRIETVYRPLVRYLAEVGDRPLDLVVATTGPDFRRRLQQGASIVMCPDGMALDLDRNRFVPVVVGRRPAPQNLRPRGVLIYRRSAGIREQPWLSHPQRTIIGDSLSLAATGAWRRMGSTSVTRDQLQRCSFGPDPYDHGPALHALRLGCFDYALVRQWDAERFFQNGLLAQEDWGMKLLVVPVPDITLFAARDLPAQTRMSVGEKLSALGRTDGTESPRAGALQSGLNRLQLVGFNLLLEPDFDFVRRNFRGSWPDSPE